MRRRQVRYETPREVFLVNPEVVLPKGVRMLKVETVLKKARGWSRRGVEPIKSPKAVADLFLAMEHLDRERLYTVLLDPGNRPVGIQLVSIGGQTSAVAVPMDIFRGAIAAGAAGIIVVHNHPAGDPLPSPEDFAVLRRLKEAAKILGLKVLDFIIVGEKGEYYSAGEDGRMP